MKKLLLFGLTIAMISCSKDDNCEEDKQVLIDRRDKTIEKLIQIYEDALEEDPNSRHPNPSAQIKRIKEQYRDKINKACD